MDLNRRIIRVLCGTIAFLIVATAIAIGLDSFVTVASSA